jgi:hypothetical protein
MATPPWTGEAEGGWVIDSLSYIPLIGHRYPLLNRSDPPAQGRWDRRVSLPLRIIHAHGCAHGSEVGRVNNQKSRGCRGFRVWTFGDAPWGRDDPLFRVPRPPHSPHFCAVGFQKPDVRLITTGRVKCPQNHETNGYQTISSERLGNGSMAKRAVPPSVGARSASVGVVG